NGAFHIAFTGINMASSAGIPLARKIFLSMRSLLQKQFAQAVKDENVHSTMIEIFPMDCFSVKRSECLIALIDHRQALVRICAISDRGPQSIDDLDPFFQRNIFSPGC